MKNKTDYVHLLNKPEQASFIFIPGIKENIDKAFLFSGKKEIKFKQLAEGCFIYLDSVVLDDTDTIIQIEFK